MGKMGEKLLSVGLTVKNTLRKLTNYDKFSAEPTVSYTDNKLIVIKRCG